MAISLPYKFEQRKYQVEPWNTIMDESFRRGILVWPRRNGKDLFSWNVFVCKAMQRVGLYFYIAPYYNQARSIIWNGQTNDGRRFLDYIPKQLIKSKTKQDMSINLVNGSQIKLHGSDNIDRIVGTNPIGIVLTEASLHKQNVWDYLRPILAANDGWALFNGTPRGLNDFYKYVEYAKKSDLWYYQYLNRDITGIPSIEAIQQDRDSGMPESLIQQEYFCSFTSSSEETLIPLDLIEPFINAPVDPDTVKANPKIVGVDVAFAEKGDQAVITKRQGPLTHPQEKYRGLDNMGLATRIVNIINEWSPKFVVIDNGRGEGVISRLSQLGFGHLLIGVDFGGSTSLDLYHRKKDEIWCRAKNYFHQYKHISLPDDEELIRDLTAPTFKLNDYNRIVLESKDSLKRKGVSSTDCGDSFVLTFAEEFDSFFGNDEEKVNRQFPEYVNTPPTYNPMTFMQDKLNEYRVLPGFTSQY